MIAVHNKGAGMTSTRSGSAVLIRTVAASVLLVVAIGCVSKTRLNRTSCGCCMNDNLTCLEYFNACTVHLLLCCASTNKCTLISHIITHLHVSTLSCHSQGACNQYLPSYTSTVEAAYYDYFGTRAF